MSCCGGVFDRGNAFVDEQHGGNKWPGFSKESLRETMEGAGLAEIDLKIYKKPMVLPDEFGGGEKWIVWAKGRVRGSG